MINLSNLRDSASLIFSRQRWVTDLSQRIQISAGTLRRWAKGDGNPPHPEVQQRIYDACVVEIHKRALATRALFPDCVQLSEVGARLVISMRVNDARVREDQR